ncbi:hypothetical protein Tco_1124977 [Tanacetum coccineum]|uniref:Uncharacterized protein n=1 Tax=Tanacetum coccineum TaxID=301880 RepID=A0ABQ5J7N6_9ASTR
MLAARLGLIKAHRIKATHLEMKVAGQGMNAMTKVLLGMIRTSDLPMTWNQWLRSRNECNDKGTSGDDTDIRPSYDMEPMVEDDHNADDHENEHVVLADLIVN